MRYLLVWCCLWTLCGCDGLFLMGDSSNGETFVPPTRVVVEDELAGTTWLAKGDYMPLPFAQLAILVFGQQAEDGSYPAKGYNEEGVETMSLEVRGMVLALEGQQMGQVLYDSQKLTITSNSLVPGVMEFERSL
ncbi:MAG: hypothetical protein SPF89_00710 [Sphaerochaetaceae bacterium]|nr:hypothetical protein [Spirochaetales bacterium]MDY5498604.1 hypothetical protein [Sphaerochaetaceae bacterium]